uniref:Piwi domain-containing protein n=1 Tax=Psoroptes ovis TaxID=83912 RepID=A0A3B0QP40_PSOOV|nr:hypothetical protein BLA29_009219 [Psoroptes ovis]
MQIVKIAPMKSNYFIVRLEDPDLESDLVKIIRKHLKLHYLCRKNGKFIDHRDSVYVHQTNMKQQSFQIVAGFTFEVIQAEWPDGSLKHLINICVKLYTVDDDFKLITEMSPQCTEIVRRKARLAPVQCFKRIEKYITNLAESIREQQIEIDLKPIEYDAQLLPSPVMRSSIKYQETNFQWAIICLTDDAKRRNGELQSLKDGIINKANEYQIHWLREENCVGCESIKISWHQEMDNFYGRLCNNQSSLIMVILIIDQECSLVETLGTEQVINICQFYSSSRDQLKVFHFVLNQLLAQHDVDDESIIRLLIQMCCIYNQTHAEYLTLVLPKSLDLDRIMTIGWYERKDTTISMQCLCISINRKQNKWLSMQQFDAELVMEEYHGINDCYPSYILIFRNLFFFQQKMDKSLFFDMVSQIKQVMDDKQSPTQVTLLLVEKKPRDCLIITDDAEVLETAEHCAILAQSSFMPVIKDSIQSYAWFCVFTDNSKHGLKHVRPTKYHVLLDEMDMSREELAHLCFVLCHCNCMLVNDVPVCLESAEQYAKWQMETMEGKELVSNR